MAEVWSVYCLAFSEKKELYHDAALNIYYHLEGFTWQVSASLPNDLRVRLCDAVSMELDTDKPWACNDQHKEEERVGKRKNIKEWGKNGTKLCC